ncbi:MAG: efflux RND transporter periplasmic adaptor subunit [Pirellulaceae bacterium]|nr:efflux RND transporter periplasmic adaptor subunit [Pirellulaceae bacterium]
MNFVKLLLVCGLLGVAFVAGWYVREVSRSVPVELAPDEARVVHNPVKALGKLVPRSGLLNIFGPPNQVIDSIPLSNDDPIDADKTELATFAMASQLRRQVEMANSQAADVRQELEQRALLAHGQVEAARIAVSLAELQWQQALVRDLLEIPEQQLVTAKAKLTRLEALAKDPKTEAFIAKTAVDEQKLAIKEAEIQLQYAIKRHDSAIQAAELELDAAKLALDGAIDVHTVLVARQAKPTSADLAVSAAKAAAQESRLLAPLDGVVVQVMAKAGEVSLHTPLMQIADLTRMDCIAEVPDRLIAQVAVGDMARLESPALPSDLTGEVVEISRVVGGTSLTDPNPLALVDRKTVEVRIQIIDADVAAAARLIHLQVNVTFSKK